MNKQLDIQLKVNKEDFKKKLDIKDGITPSRDELLGLIKPLIPIPKNGKDADEGRVVKQVLSQIPIPENGKDGIDGNHGSPDTAEDIVNKIISLKGNNRLSYSVLKDTPSIYSPSDYPVGNGGGGGQNINFRDSNSAQISAYVTDLQFGTGITPTYSNGKITLTGGSTVTLKTNNVTNTTQTILNLIQGSNMIITDDGVGGITFASTGGGTATTDYSTNFLFMGA